MKKILNKFSSKNNHNILLTFDNNKKFKNERRK